MTTQRRNFIKSMALLGGATIIDFNLKAQSIMRKTSANSKLQLRWAPYDLQMKHVFTISNSSRKTTPVVLTSLTYDGVTGYGEASLPPYLGESQASVMEFLKKIDLSGFSNPFHIEEILQYVDKIAENNTAAKAAVDIALHDLLGKIMKQPWHKMWGLNTNKIPDTTYTIGIDTDDMIRTKVKEVEGQFNILKVKLGTADDKRIIRAVRSATQLPIAIDANQGWKDKHEALDLIHWLKEQGVVMIEQPMGKYNLEDNAWITERSPLPVFGDESVQRLRDVQKVKGVFTGINIKLMKCTGLHEAWKMRNLAESLGLKVMLGCMTETSCAISAASQLVAGMDFADLDGALLIQNDAFDGARLDKGKIVPTDEPGIGIKQKIKIDYK
ncbi:MAG: dipeptide epimerase [Chitinophagaceae bacterium]|nr:dipeptide epimerase [Chitinophagaceae bacterium]